MPVEYTNHSKEKPTGAQVDTLKVFPQLSAFKKRAGVNYYVLFEIFKTRNPAEGLDWG